MKLAAGRAIFVLDRLQQEAGNRAGMRATRVRTRRNRTCLLRPHLALLSREFCHVASPKGRGFVGSTGLFVRAKEVGG